MTGLLVAALLTAAAPATADQNSGTRSVPAGADPTAVQHVGRPQSAGVVQPRTVEMSALPQATPADLAQPQADRPPRVYAEQNKAMLPLVPKPTALKVPDRPGNQPSASAASLFFQNDAAGTDNNVFGGSPPDPGGIAGENHFVQTVNSSWMGIYRKSDLAQLRTTNLQTFFGSGRGVFDPHGPPSDAWSLELTVRP